MELDSFYFWHEVHLDERGISAGIADYYLQSEISLESLFTSVYLSSGIHVMVNLLVGESQIRRYSSAGCIGGGDVPLIAEVIRDVCQQFSDFGKRLFDRYLVLSWHGMQEVESLDAGLMEERPCCPDSRYESRKNTAVMIVQHHVSKKGAREQENEYAKCYCWYH